MFTSGFLFGLGMILASLAVIVPLAGFILLISLFTGDRPRHPTPPSEEG